MRRIAEAAREIDVVHQTEVLVVGSGPGGLAAALAAARAGVQHHAARTQWLLRRAISPQVGVEGFAWYRHENTVDSEGIGIEFEERAKAMGAAMPEPQSISHALDAEMFKYVADVLVQEAGVEPMLHRQFVAPILKDGAICGVITESKAGREAILARRIVDGTGDADVAARSGAPVRKTPREEMMAASVMFSMTGVNKRRFIDAVKSDPQTYKDWIGNGEWNIETSGKEDDLFSPFLRKPFKQAVAAGVIPASLSTLAGTWGAVSDQGDLTYLNVIHLPACDGTDPADLTRGEIEGRRQAVHAIEALRRFMPGCENAKLRNFGMTLGVRDTRKIDAQYNLTAADVREQGRFEDSIGIFPEFIDGYGLLILPTTGRYFHVPVSLARPAGRRAPHRGGPLHRRRQGVACGRAQHDVLHRERAGRGRRRSHVAEVRPGLRRARCPAGAGGIEAPGRAASPDTGRNKYRRFSCSKQCGNTCGPSRQATPKGGLAVRGGRLGPVAIPGPVTGARLRRESRQRLGRLEAHRARRPRQRRRSSAGGRVLPVRLVAEGRLAGVLRLCRCLQLRSGHRANRVRRAGVRHPPGPRRRREQVPMTQAKFRDAARTGQASRWPRSSGTR